MLQAFNPNKNIMSTKSNPFTYKVLKSKNPADFIHVYEDTYPSYKNKGGGGKGATFRIAYKNEEGVNTGTPFEIQTPPVNLYFPNVKGDHQGKLPSYLDKFPDVQDAKRRCKFQVGEFFGKVKSTLQENGVNTEKMIQWHLDWYDWMTACLDEIANQIHAKATDKEFRARMKDENVNEGVVHDLLKSVKPKTSLESFKDNFKAGLYWEEQSDKQGQNIGRLIDCWCKVQTSRFKPTVSYPIITKKLLGDDLMVSKNVTPSDDVLAKAYKWDTEKKSYSYIGNNLDDNGNPIEPDIVKHNQVARVVFQPQFYASPIRGLKLVLKKIQIVQEAPSGKRKREEETEIDDDWQDCM